MECWCTLASKPTSLQVSIMEWWIWLRIFKFCRYWAERFSVSYIGEVDDKNRPHGFGEWWDTHYYGEHLVGLWNSGKPVGPFISREKGSSSGFKNLRIGYFMNRADPITKRYCWPVFAPDGQVLLGCTAASYNNLFRRYESPWRIGLGYWLVFCV